MVLQNYQNLIEMTSNMIYIVALGVGLKCPRKIHLNTQWGEHVQKWSTFLDLPTVLTGAIATPNFAQMYIKNTTKGRFKSSEMNSNPGFKMLTHVLSRRRSLVASTGWMARVAWQGSIQYPLSALPT